MRTRIAAAALLAALAAAPAAAQDVDWMWREMPTSGEVDYLAIDRQVDSISGLSEDERTWYRAALADLQASAVEGRLAANQGLVASFELAPLRTGTVDYSGREITFTYTPKNVNVVGGVQYLDDRWVTPVDHVYGTDGELKLVAGFPAAGTGTSYVFFVRATTARAITYTLTVDRASTTTTPPDPPTGGWQTSGTGASFVTIPDSVDHFRVRSSFSGYTENFRVVCGKDFTGVGDGLLVNELIGTSWGSVNEWFSATNRGSYGALRDRPCGTVTVKDNVPWEFEER